MAVLANHAEGGIILVVDFVEPIQELHFMENIVDQPVEEVIQEHQISNSLD